MPLVSGTLEPLKGNQGETLLLEACLRVSPGQGLSLLYYLLPTSLNLPPKLKLHPSSHVCSLCPEVSQDLNSQDPQMQSPLGRLPFIPHNTPQSAESCKHCSLHETGSHARRSINSQCSGHESDLRTVCEFWGPPHPNPSTLPTFITAGTSTLENVILPPTTHTHISPFWEPSLTPCPVVFTCGVS